MGQRQRVRYFELAPIEEDPKKTQRRTSFLGEVVAMASFPRLLEALEGTHDVATARPLLVDVHTWLRTLLALPSPTWCGRRPPYCAFPDAASLKLHAASHWNAPCGSCRVMSCWIRCVVDGGWGR